MALLGKHKRAKMYWYITKLFRDLGKREIILDETQKYVVKITRSIINKPETEFYESATDCVIYIHCDHITIKVNYDDSKIIMMNGKYYYYFSLPPEKVNEIVRKVRKASSIRSLQWELQFTKNTITNLESILGEVYGDK
jgi:hypothetical protein